MKRVSLIAVPLLLAGALPALAQEIVVEQEVVVEPDVAEVAEVVVPPANGDLDGDGIPNGDDPTDDRFDAQGQRIHFDVGEFLPEGSFGPQNLVDLRQRPLDPPAEGHAWYRYGNHFYEADVRSGRVLNAIYNLRD